MKAKYRLGDIVNVEVKGGVIIECKEVCGKIYYKVEGGDKDFPLWYVTEDIMSESKDSYYVEHNINWCPVCDDKVNEIDKYGIENDGDDDGKFCARCGYDFLREADDRV